MRWDILKSFRCHKFWDARAIHLTVKLNYDRIRAFQPIGGAIEQVPLTSFNINLD